MLGEAVEQMLLEGLVNGDEDRGSTAKKCSLNGCESAKVQNGCLRRVDMLPQSWGEGNAPWKVVNEMLLEGLVNGDEDRGGTEKRKIWR